MPGSDFDNVPQWFQIPATEKPGFFALRSGMERLTYAGLDARTDALRDRLTGAAIAKGARAGILLGRTLCHHILPGGAGSRGAFVPLDPSGQSGQRITRRTRFDQEVEAAGRARHQENRKISKSKNGRCGTT